MTASHSVLLLPRFRRQRCECAHYTSRHNSGQTDQASGKELTDYTCRGRVGLCHLLFSHYQRALHARLILLLQNVCVQELCDSVWPVEARSRPIINRTMHTKYLEAWHSVITQTSAPHFPRSDPTMHPLHTEPHRAVFTVHRMCSSGLEDLRWGLRLAAPVFVSLPSTFTVPHQYGNIVTQLENPFLKRRPQTHQTRRSKVFET
jgi:hypothetical protein